MNNINKTWPFIPQCCLILIQVARKCFILNNFLYLMVVQAARQTTGLYQCTCNMGMAIADTRHNTRGIRGKNTLGRRAVPCVMSVLFTEFIWLS